MNYLSYALAASALGPARLPGGSDVVLVFQMSPVSQVLPALVLRALRGAPVVTWVQDLWPQSVAATGVVRSPALLAAIGCAVRPRDRACDRLLVQSEGFREPLTLAGVPNDRIYYLPNWAEEVYEPLSGALTPPGGPVDLPEGFVVMLAGNLGRAQALGTLLDAADRLRHRSDVHWVVVGDGTRRDWLAAEVVRRGLSGRVHLIGRRPVEDMPALFGRADAMLVTLVRDQLMAMTVPSRLQSYLACGRPVVAALDGEGARVVRQAGSTAVPAEDGAGLARVV
nr:glycosyltransferase family 4 protein [Micromonospora sp. DSM 115978]